MSCRDRLIPVAGCIARDADVEVLMHVADAEGRDRDYVGATVSDCRLRPAIGEEIDLTARLTDGPGTMPQIIIVIPASATAGLTAPQMLELCVRVTRGDKGIERPRVRLELV